MSERHNRTQTKPRPACPECGSMYVRKCGVRGVQRFLCKHCNHWFNERPAEQKPAKSGVTPEPRRAREFVELKRDPFAFWRLAMAGPR